MGYMYRRTQWGSGFSLNLLPGQGFVFSNIPTTITAVFQRLKAKRTTDCKLHNHEPNYLRYFVVVTESWILSPHLYHRHIFSKNEEGKSQKDNKNQRNVSSYYLENYKVPHWICFLSYLKIHKC